MKLNDRPFDEQVAAVLENLGAILEEAGSEPSKLVSVRVYITDIDKWGEFNGLYEKFVGAHKPARYCDEEAAWLPFATTLLTAARHNSRATAHHPRHPPPCTRT